MADTFNVEVWWDAGAAQPGGEPNFELEAVLTLAEFLEHNDGMEEEELAVIRSFAPGDSLRVGGGAAPLVEVRRPAETTNEDQVNG